jgi:hypothetical protein
MNEALERFTPKDIIRTETALSRFPIHRLSKKGNISIEIRVSKPNGELKTKWEVDYSSKHGQPGPLAYKLDTLIINRRIEEAGKPTPKIIRLGSHREICKELGINEGQGVRNVKKALLQNASSFITAKLTYKKRDGEEASVEVADTRYGVIFTGEKLPTGEKANAVYIVLHDIYREIINNAQTRPLDYDYMRELTPTAQRFYELLSYQIFAALKNKTTAKIRYSEFCMYAPQTRYFDWEHIKKQMYKLHRSHLASHYIEKIQFEQEIGEDGQPDWLMIYVPGVRAKGQHIAFQRKPVPRIKHTDRNLKQLNFLTEINPEPFPEPVLTFTPQEEELISRLVQVGVAEIKAISLVKTHREATEAQIAAFPYRETRSQKNAAGWLITAIENNYVLPVAYLEDQEKNQKAGAVKEKTKLISTCKLCDERGLRFIKSERYPSGAMKPCTHDPKIESKFQNAL